MSGRLTRAQLDEMAKQRAGCVQLRYAQQTGTLVGVYRSLEAGMESDPEGAWSSVCEEHHTLVCHPTRTLAVHHAVDPQGWCEECRG